ncbi:MAG: MBL fold hydrolase, partial [Mesorhizobium amorphae]
MEPVMLEGPLLEGRPVRLGVLDYGLFRVFGGDRVIGLSGFLVETDRGERVVIDTGLPEKYAHDAKAAALEDGLGAFGEVVAVGPENLPLAQLGLLGLGEDDIDVLVLTHTHVDHLGGMHLFPRAPMVMAVAERALARPLYWGSVQ